MPSLELKRFDMRKIQFTMQEALIRSVGPVIVLIGRRETGKSVLIKDIMYHHRNIPVGTVISGTELSNDFFSTIVPKMFIHDEYKTSTIEKVIQRQKMVLEHNKKNQIKQDPRTFTIMDDCLFDDKWSREKIMRMIFMNGRHFRVMLVISMQYPLGVPPVLRTNIDYVFILRENVRKNREKIYDNYAGMFPTFELFCQFMDKCTENYECLVIDNNVKSNKLEDQVFWYKADIHQDFQLGAKEYWEMSKNLNFDDNDEKYDPSLVRKHSQGPNINIKKVY
jgi:hypothetical protein